MPASLWPPRLGRAGQLEAEEIAAVVKRVGTLLKDEHLEKPIADALELVPEEAGGANGVCRIGTLIVTNACLLQQRLRDIPELRLMLGPDRVGGAESPRNELEKTWKRILKRDYAPVFRPALAVLKAIGDGAAVEAAVSELHEAAGRVAPKERARENVEANSQARLRARIPAGPRGTEGDRRRRRGRGRGQRAP